jgi:hypothetical protein
MFKVLIFYILFTLLLGCFGKQKNEWISKECEDRIFRDCNHKSEFTDEEIDNARKYIQHRFAKTNPSLKPCNKLVVRKNIKCLTNKELKKFIVAFKKLYSRKIIDKFTKIHDRYWPAVHKFSVGPIWHRKFINELEKEISKIDSSVTMPYWEFLNDFSAPEKSLVFEIFGHAGNESNNYCVSDGAFANQRVNYPKPHCIRRQWNENGTVGVWEPPEYYTSVLQIGPLTSFLRPEMRTLAQYGKLKTVLEFLNFVRDVSVTNQPYSQYAILHAFTAHFKTHLNVGGYAGDMSIPIAPNDVMFYLLHEGQHYHLMKWQLSHDDHLVPRSFNLGIRMDYKTKKVVMSNIDTDFLDYYENVTVKETFQLGFGDQCYVYDQLIDPINKIMRNEKMPEPVAIKRLRASLPSAVFSKYFPKLALYPENVTFFDYLFPDVGDCNPGPVCQTMPVALTFLDTENSRRQYKAFIEAANLDITRFSKPAEDHYYEIMNQLNQYYCSPYVA